jgi:hypothetical protein
LFRGFKTLSGKTWQGELLFSELATLRKQAAALDLDGEVKFQDLAQEFSRRNRLTQKAVKIAAPKRRFIILFSLDRERFVGFAPRKDSTTE